MTDEEAAKFTEAIQRGGTLCLPPGLYDQFIVLPAGREALLTGIKVVKSELLRADEVVVLVPEPPLSSLRPMPDLWDLKDALGEGFRSLPPFQTAFDDLLRFLPDEDKPLVTSDAPSVLKGEGEER